MTVILEIHSNIFSKYKLENNPQKLEDEKMFFKKFEKELMLISICVIVFINGIDVKIDRAILNLK